MSTPITRSLKFKGALPAGVRILSTATYRSLVIICTDDGVYMIDRADEDPCLEKLEGTPFADRRVN